MKLETIVYSNFTLSSIQTSDVYDVPKATSTGYSRVEIPFAPCNIIEMEHKGYIFADRTLKVEISLKKSKIDYQKLVRFEIKKENDSRAILAIAENSFATDRRFHVRPKPDQEVAKEIIQQYVKTLSEIYVCVYKEQVVGFIDLEPYEGKNCFISLAAVMDKYRATGVAVSLYANAILTAKRKNCEKVYGRISSTNTAIMNLYSQLGGTFSEPLDVFVRNEE